MEESARDIIENFPSLGLDLISEKDSEGEQGEQRPLLVIEPHIALERRESEVEIRAIRSRKLTDKGKCYHLDICNQKRHSAYSGLSKHCKLVYETLGKAEQPRIDQLEALRDNLDLLKEEFNEAQGVFDSCLESDEEKNESYHWFDLRDREVTECRLRLSEALRTLEKQVSPRVPSLRSAQTGFSRRSGASSRHSSARSLRLEAASKTARLKTEAAFLDSVLEKEQEMKRLQLQREIAMSEAEEKAFKKILDEERDLKFSLPVPDLVTEELVKKDEKPVLNPLSPTYVPPSPIPSSNQIKLEPSTSQPEPARFPVSSETFPSTLDPLAETLKQLVDVQKRQIELSGQLAHQQKAHYLPVKEPPIFSGDAFDYPSFITAFDSIISANVPADKDRLYFLEKYTNAKANEVVRGFLAVNSESAYQEARKLLDERFGNPVHVAEAYKSRLRKWPQIKDGDSAGLQAFSDFLIRCKEAANSVGSIGDLDSNQVLFQVSAKLPSYSGVKWCRHAHEVHAKAGSRPVSFADLVKFVKAEADLANDPIFSPDALRRERKGAFEKGQEKHRANSGVTPRAGSFVTEVSADRDGATWQSRNQQPKCSLCEQPHEITKCLEFKKKTLEERRDVVKTKGLCFGCLKSGHLSKACPARLTCEECDKSHPTLLHGAKPDRRNYKGAKPANPRTQTPKPAPTTREDPSPDPSANANANVCNSTGATGDVVTSMIVPVFVFHKDTPEKRVKTYTLLDDGSDSTFITSSLLEEIGVRGSDVSLRLNTMHGENRITTQRVDGLVVEAVGHGSPVDLPKAYARPAIPSSKDQVPSPETADKWPHLQGIRSLIPPVEEDLAVGLLIGCNCPKALKPKEVILGKDEEPYAIRTSLGWGIIGPIIPHLSAGGEESITCNRIFTCEIGGKTSNSKFVLENKAKEEMINPEEVKKMFEIDFSEHTLNDTGPISQEDKRFLELVGNGIRFEDGHYSIPLPFKTSDTKLPNNRSQAWSRIVSLKKRLLADDTYCKHYVDFMANIIEKGYAETVPESDLSDRNKPAFYINHHGVFNEKKGNKIRVVFNCSQQFQGESLNAHLLQGPDLTNTLIGVLARFRRAPVAVMADIESMFYQVRVPIEDRNMLRFFWFKDGDVNQDPQEFRMTVHLFGATSSPGCANFALKATADDNEETLGETAAEFVRRDFYVDDGLKSVESQGEAIELVRSVKEMCKRGGFNLHKFTSNKREVLEHIPVQDRAEDVKNLDLGHDTLPTERALGVLWCAESDAFKFSVALKDRPCTRRGILSTISSIFDPLGFVAPVLLEGKSLLQDLCRSNIGWDDPVPEEVQRRWMKWKTELADLQSFSIPRCYRPHDFGNPAKAEIHHFSDASFKGYGQCSYLRLINEEGRIHCSFVMGKARVTPLKPVTVPRLELTAAVLSVRVSEQLKKELGIELTDEIFWTDSKVVLGYISNSVRRFHVYVANRIQEIQEKSSTKQWRYVETASNPADDASRGLRPRELAQSKWSRGPEFLWKPESEWKNDESSDVTEISTDDPEVKKVVSMATELSTSWPSLVERIAHFSDWMRAKKAVALCRRYIRKLRYKVQRRLSMRKVRAQRKERCTPVSIQEIREAETIILRAAQRESKLDTSVSGPLGKLDPYVDTEGVIRVGGRLKSSSLSDQLIHPVVVPKSGHVTNLLIHHFHNKVHHQGRGITINEIRASGYWLIGASTTVASAIHRCVTCRKLRAKPQEQRMSDLPNDRLEPAPAFSYAAVDYFGPYEIVERRKPLKRYGVLFTCMASRAIHLEVAHTLETDSFICALRRFICRRGPVRQLRSDQGTNFVGARNELKMALKELDDKKIADELHQHQCDWFSFRMNVPSASHMGGVWERQIRSVRNVLNALLETNGSQLNDEALRTFLCEAESIVNSRPLTVESLNDPSSLSPLTPNHLLTLKTKVVLPPPGQFTNADQYSRKRWRRVQHLANEFWSRWKKEYLMTLQNRQKWSKVCRDMCVGDIVLIKDDDNLPRNRWQLARVAETYPSADGYVRKVKLAIADAALDRTGKRVKPAKFLERPVQKLVLLHPTET